MAKVKMQDVGFQPIAEESIDVFGAREHNLKNIDISIPKNKLVVITGISGSGKSSLAFDTIYAEGQRRYMESFSAYARSFIGDMERPDVDKINGLSPVILSTSGRSISPINWRAYAEKLSIYLRCPSE